MTTLMVLLLATVLGVLILGGAWLLTSMRSGPLFSRRENLEVVTDLDAIMSRSIGVKIAGKVHEVKPLTFEKFLEAMNALARLDQLKVAEKITPDELASAYENLFGIMCPTITRSHIDGMSQQQVGALFATVCEQIMGKPKFDAEKKSTEKSTGSKLLRNAG